MSSSTQAQDFIAKCKKCNPVTSPQETITLLQSAVKIAQIAETLKSKVEKLNEIIVEQDGTIIELTDKVTELEQQQHLLHALELADKIIEKSKAKPKEKAMPKPKLESNKYGEYQHVLLTKEQYSKLVDTYGAAQAEAGIKAVDEYCQQHGKTYKDYNLTIRKFLREGVKGTEKPQNQHSYDLNAYMNHAMNNTPEVR